MHTSHWLQIPRLSQEISIPTLGTVQGDANHSNLATLILHQSPYIRICWDLLRFDHYRAHSEILRPDFRGNRKAHADRQARKLKSRPNSQINPTVSQILISILIEPDPWNPLIPGFCHDPTNAKIGKLKTYTTSRRKYYFADFGRGMLYFGLITSQCVFVY